MKEKYQIINQNRIDSAWTGAPIGLVPGTSIHMPETPSGPLICVFRIAPKLNQMASLTLTAGESDPTIIMIQPGSSLPGVFIHNWAGANLSVTNISHTEGAEIRIATFGVMPGAKYAELPRDEMVEFPSQHSARCAAGPGLQQVVMQAKSAEKTLFAVISGGSDDESQNAYVFALNAEENTGPGADKEAPPGYYSTTIAENSSYEFFVEKNDGDAMVPLYLMNISPEAVAANVLIRRL